MKSENIYQGRVICLNKEQVLLPNGQQTTHDIVRHPGGVVIAALDPKLNICMIRQYRHTAGDWIWEVPAGTLSPGEDTLAAAKRELEEEAGLTAGNWEKISSFYTAPGFCDEVLHLYFARDLGFVEQRLDHDECIEVHWIALNQALNWLNDGTIKDGKTMLALFCAQQRA